MRPASAIETVSTETAPGQRMVDLNASRVVLKASGEPNVGFHVLNTARYVTNMTEHALVVTVTYLETAVTIHVTICAADLNVLKMELVLTQRARMDGMGKTVENNATKRF